MALYYTREVVPALPAVLVDLLGRGRHETGAQLAAAIAGTLASVTYASAILGQTLGGRVAGGPRATVWLLVIGLVFTGGLVGIGLASGMPILAFGIIFAAAYFMAQPITNLMVARYSAGSRHGLVYGVYFTSGFGTGALAPAVAGLIAGQGHLARVFLLFAVAGLGSIGLRAALIAATRDR